jgi:hypothetical protein
MIALFWFVLAALASAFKSKSRLEAENAVLRHQLIVLRRKLKGRARLTNNDRWFFVQMYRWFFVQMYRWFPSILPVLMIMRPETLVRWHRAGFCRDWRWKSRRRGGRPRIEIERRALIRQMSTENSLRGAPRIHGELLKLGFSVAQSSVAKYMVKRRGPPSQGWKTFLRNHAPDIAAMDLFVVPTIGFRLLYGFVIVRLHRRDLVWINVTANPTAEWVARQITEDISLGWGSPLYDPGPRSDLRRHCHTPIASHGHSGQTDCTSLALAEWLCRTNYRIDPARVFGPHHCLGRGTSAPESNFLCCLLQLRQNASVVAQGCADFSSGSADRCHKFTQYPWRTSSPIRSRLGFRYTQLPLQGSSLPSLGLDLRQAHLN